MALGRSSLWILLCTMMMRALVPTGFMLDHAIGDAPTLIACDGKGAIFADPNAHHGDHHGGQRGTMGKGDCPFSSAGAVDTPPLAASESVATDLATDFRPIAVLRPYRPSAAAAPPPSTGPPVIA